MLSKAPKIELSKLLNPRSIRANSNILPVLSVSNTRGFITQSEQFSDRKVASEDTSNYKVVLKDDYAYNPARINVGSLARLRTFEKGIVSPMYVVFSANEKVSKNYLDQFFYSSIFKQQMKVLLSGSVRQTLDFPALQEMTISLPILSEQEKIGAFLSAIDRLIEQQKEKVDRIKFLKKGYLQKMFPADGEDKPKLGFKNFHNKWKLIQLGQVGSFTSNGVDKTIDPTETQVFLLNYMDVYKRRKLNLLNYTQLMRVTATQKQILENNVLKGDVFFTPTSETPEDIGRVHVIEETLPNTVYSYHLMRYRPIKAKFALLFPNFVFDSIKFRKKLFLVAKGVQRFVISKPDFESLKIEIPEVLEQEKISGFLTALDRVVEKEEASMNQYESIKKAYLQKIFAD